MYLNPWVGVSIRIDGLNVRELSQSKVAVLDAGACEEW